MALEIQYLGTDPQYVLSLKLGERQYLNHVFRSTGEKLDVTNIASAGELLRHPLFRSLLEQGKFGITPANARPDTIPLATLSTPGLMSPDDKNAIVSLSGPASRLELTIS